MAGYTTAMCGSFKAELAMGGHCFLATQSAVAFTTANASPTASAGTTTGLAVGMAITGAAVAAGSVIASIDSSTQITSSKNFTGTNGAGLTFTGDSFKIALGKPSPTGTYGASTTNYSNLTGNSDEITGTGYTAGGQALANNISPSNSAGNAFWQWSVNPSWTSSTFSAAAALIYNTSSRLNTNNRAVSVHDFGGTQTVSAGTFTLIQPSNAASTSLLQIN